MKQLSVIFCLILSVFMVGCGRNKSSNLHPVEIGGKYGYINTGGNLVIAAQFDRADEFSEGLAKVRVKDKYGFIDNKGEIVINPEFDDALPFSEGLAAVSIGGRAFNLIADRDPIGSRKCGFIDKKGHWIITPVFHEVKSFSEGLAAVQVDEKWGFINKSGKFIINPEFSSVENFSEGFAFVISYRESSSLHGLIDKSGKFLKVDYVPNGGFSDGLAEVIDPQTHSSGWVDKKGVCVIEPKFSDPAYFSEGFARVRIGERYAYINKSGIIQTIQQFEYASYSYSEGLAAVKFESQYGYIDRKGEMAIEPIYDYAGNFKNGLAEVRLKGERSIINKAGIIVWTSEK